MCFTRISREIGACTAIHILYANHHEIAVRMKIKNTLPFHQRGIYIIYAYIDSIS